MHQHKLLFILGSEFLFELESFRDMATVAGPFGPGMSLLASRPYLEVEKEEEEEEEEEVEVEVDVRIMMRKS